MTKRKPVGIPLNEEEKAAVLKAARAMGMTLSAYVRHIVVTEANK